MILKPSELTEEIGKIQNKIVSISPQIEKKEKEVEELKRDNARVVANSVNQKRKPASLTNQRNRIARLNVEIEELKYAVKELNAQLSEKKEQLQFSQDFGTFQSFKESEKQFFDIVSTCKNNLKQFNSLSERVSSPLEGILGILNRLRNELSLPEFFEDGTVKNPNPEGNQKWIDELVSGYQNLFDDLPQNVNLKKFEDQIRYAISVSQAVQSGSRGIPGSGKETQVKPPAVDPMEFIRKRPQMFSEGDRQRAGLKKGPVAIS